MPGLSKARNALSHNMGRVDQYHTTHERMLRLSWIGPEFVLRDRVVTGAFEEIHVDAGEVMQARIGARNREFAIGKPIDLSPHELSEICFTYLFLANRVTLSLQERLLRMGIPTLPAA
jgi:hypothetical protein